MQSSVQTSTGGKWNGWAHKIALEGTCRGGVLYVVVKDVIALEHPVVVRGKFWSCDFHVGVVHPDANGVIEHIVVPDVHVLETVIWILVMESETLLSKTFTC